MDESIIKFVVLYCLYGVSSVIIAYVLRMWFDKLKIENFFVTLNKVFMSLILLGLVISMFKIYTMAFYN